jgi:hypothetical protein
VDGRRSQMPPLAVQLRFDSVPVVWSHTSPLADVPASDHSYVIWTE